MKLDSGMAVLSALALGLVGEALVLFAGQSTLGGGLLLAGAGVLVAGFWKEGTDSAPRTDLSVRTALVLLAAVLLVALFLRRLQINAIPWGLNNDEGIEGLIACRFLIGEKITPFSSIGLSRETLYHVLLMPLFMMLGVSIGSMRLLSFLCGMAAVGLAYLVGKAFFSRRVGLLAAFLLAVSPWHILYSRTGLRNILLPVFLLAVLWVFQRALADRKPVHFVLTGALLAAGLYSYTSFRIVPVAVLVWAVARRRLLGKPPLTWKQAGLVAGTFLLLMIPQLASALSDPAGFVTRGGYVLAQTPDASIPQNLLFSALMPVLYPSRFGLMQSRWFFSDGVSIVYAAVGRTPETLVSGVLMIFGVVFTAMRFVRRRGEGEGTLLVFYLLTLLSVGLAGPSLTRMIGALPLLCLMGALFLDAFLGAPRTMLPGRARAGLVALLLVAAAALGYEQYFLRAGRSPRAMFYYAAPQTIMGLYAASRAVDHPVHVLYTEQPETLRFLTFTRQQLIDLQHEPEGLDMERVRRALGHQEFVLENHRRFLPVFTALAQASPWAEATILRDVQHDTPGAVAYILDVDPSRNRGEKNMPPGAGEPGPTPEVPEPGR
jgi:4-amino-4-deoxy-L-arabinose transferase-like glycosyltransferase